MIDIVIDDLFQLLLLLVPVVALSWMSLRLLGVRRSWIRSLLISLAGWVLGVSLAAASYENRAPSDWDLTVRVVAFTILATMAVGVAEQFVFGSGRREDELGRLRRLPHPIRRIKQTFAPTVRFQQVLRIAKRNGLLHTRFASSAGITDPEFGPCHGPRSRSAAACSSSWARSLRRGVTCCRRHSSRS
ncbi:MAG TPA: hypothetical protein VFF40_13035 [Acidimicrobiia bacterium]|nr:hypothetical protein [Acidimicrobiia bacterium]